MSDIPNDIITAPVGEFCRLSGLGRTKVYELINAGELESITIGKRRLIVMASYTRLIERRRAAEGSGGPGAPASASEAKNIAQHKRRDPAASRRPIQAPRRPQ
jgi:excisionase family DNA binding protein